MSILHDQKKGGHIHSIRTMHLLGSTKIEIQKHTKPAMTKKSNRKRPEKDSVMGVHILNLDVMLFNKAAFSDIFNFLFMRDNPR